MPADLVVKPSELMKEKTEGGANKPTPIAAARLGRKMNDTEFQGLVFDWATDARNYVDEFLANSRYHSTEYYKGKLPDVDEEDAEEDRSRAVMTEVRDTVLGMMPDLLRIFFAADGVVKFNPVPSDDPQEYAKRCQEAAQATAYIRDVVLKADNPESFIMFHDAFQDALVRKTGFIKWWPEKSKKAIYSNHTGLNEEQAYALAADEDVQIEGQREYQCPDPMTGQPAPCFDLKIKRVVQRSRERLRAIPCENIIVARRGTSMERTSLFGYTEDKTVGDFIAEGWVDSAEDLEDCDRDSNDSDNIETEARRPQTASAIGPADDPAPDPSMRLVKYGELYITADRDGDGIPELIRVITGGTRYRVVDEETVDEIPYAALCPYPEAHQFFGESVADLTMDIQRIKSRILRDTLDSLAQSVTPQLGVVESQVNLDDVLNPDTSKVIRMRAPGMVQPITTPFVGKDSLPILDLMTQTRENRTGQSDASAGLDPSVLQSSTQSAVHATLTKAQSRVEMIARIFAETGMTRLFRGLLKDTIKNCDGPRTVELMGSVVTVDPRQWNAEMDCEVTLALGRGSQQDQVGVLTAILGKQEMLIQQFGFDNPICSIDQYTYTLHKLVEASGWRNATSFFTDTSKLDPNAKQQFIQKMTQAMAAKAGAGAKSGPDPQIEQAKIASNEKIEGMKLQLEMAKAASDRELEMLKIKGNLEVARLQILANHKSNADSTAVGALVKHAGDRMDAHVAHHGNLMKNATAMSIAEMQPKTPVGGA